jgi:hypothetical protein
MEYQHPMRKAVFHAYVRQDGAEAIARAKPYGLCPMLFVADTAEDALAQAEEWRAETVAKHEAEYVERRKRLEAARAKRAVKDGVV